jgi:hypothetical protein
MAAALVLLFSVVFSNLVGYGAAYRRSISLLSEVAVQSDSGVIIEEVKNETLLGGSANGPVSSFFKDMYNSRMYGGYWQYSQALTCIKVSEHRDELKKPASWEVINVPIGDTTPVHPINEQKALMATGERAEQVLAYLCNEYRTLAQKTEWCSGKVPVVFDGQLLRSDPTFASRRDVLGNPHPNWKKMTSSQPPQAVPVMDEHDVEKKVVIDGNGRVQAIRWAIERFRQTAPGCQPNVLMELQIAKGIPEESQKCFREHIISAWKTSAAVSQSLATPPDNFLDEQSMADWFKSWDESVANQRTLEYVHPLKKTWKEP